MSKKPLKDDFYGITDVEVKDQQEERPQLENENNDITIGQEEYESAAASEEFLEADESSVPEYVSKQPADTTTSIPSASRRDLLVEKSTPAKRRKSARSQHFDSSVVNAVERIRNLLGDAKQYDPDALPTVERFVSEGDWSMERDLTAPALRNLQHVLREKEGKSALAAVKEIRAEQRNERLKQIAEYDIDGSLLSLYRIWSLIPPVFKYDPDEIAQMLSRRVLYNQDDIIAINKPYGISTKFSSTEGRIAISNALSRLQPLIAPNSERLYIMHRLDKCTTGVLLLASSRLRATELRDMFNQRKLHKKYWALVRNVPSPSEGIIDIPLKETKLGGRFKTIPVVRRDDVLEKYGRIDAPPADLGSLDKQTSVTEYKVLKTGRKCALVECDMRSGFTHQIRCHLGFGLSTPILGDHKYSNYLEYLPQRLPHDMLHSLGIRSAKTRSMPMHLHAREVLIPEGSNGRSVHIRCLLPKYFVYVLRKLKISLK